MADIDPWTLLTIVLMGVVVNNGIVLKPRATPDNSHPLRPKPRLALSCSRARASLTCRVRFNCDAALQVSKRYLY